MQYLGVLAWCGITKKAHIPTERLCMRRDINRDPAYQLVRALTLSRLVCGFVLPWCGWNELWLLAALMFAYGFLTDMLDGELARAWNVATKSGARLDPIADAVLTAGALLAMTLGDGWHWSILVLLAAAYLARGWVERHFRGDALGTFILLVPSVNLLLIALLLARFVQLASGLSYGGVLSVEILVGVVIACCKRHRIADFTREAIKRSTD